MASDLVSGIHALHEYGYRKQPDGVYRQKRGGQHWKPTPEGFLRFDGIEEVPIPFKLSPEFKGTSGLSYVKNPSCFVWTWPEDEIVKIYTVAKEMEDARLAERAKAKAEVVLDEPITAEQIEVMEAAQEAEVNPPEPEPEVVAEPEPEPKRRWWGR